MTAAYEYEVHLPLNPEEGRKYPVVFTLHGKGSNERNMFSLVEPLSGEFILIGIRGNLRLGAGYQYYELKSLGNPIRELFDRAVADLTAFTVTRRTNTRSIRTAAICSASARARSCP